MTQHVATRDMVRLAASGALVALMAAPAIAGDRALIDYIGYSEDGRFFAFEEFGIQDGSGFPYSTIFIVDLPADNWVTGSPYRVRLDTEDAELSDARDQVSELAEPQLDELDVYEAAFPLFVNADGDPRSNTGHEAVFGDPGYGLGEVMTESKLTLETFPLVSTEDCEGLSGEPALGFALKLDGTEIYRDEGTLPQTRGCTLGYKIYAIVAPAEWTQAPGGKLAVIGSYPFGFEGPDRRFIVVPLD
jgi:predicted secreted protein